MQESAKTALSYVKSNYNKFGIDKKMFFEIDIHIHVPDGSTPKDGPSAGVTIATSIISTFTGRKIKPNFAMTGEITLRGKVTAVGGIKEKSIGALLSGISNIIIPEQNKKDIQSIPEIVKSKVNYHYINKVDDALKLMMIDG
jgi:ATP-dependent Lon protease